MNINRKIITKTILLIPVILAFSSVFLTWPYPWYRNNIQLQRFSNSLSKIKLPNNAVRVADSYDEFGLLFGNSHHCDYYTSNLIHYPGSEENLKKYLSDLRIPRARAKEQNYAGENVKIRLLRITKENMQENDLIMMNLPFDSMEGVTLNFGVEVGELESGEYYLIFATDGPYEADDWRCG